MEWPRESRWPPARVGWAQGRYSDVRTAPKLGPHPCRLLWDRLILPGSSRVWVCCGKTVCYLHPPWFKLLVGLHHATGRRKWAGQRGQELGRQPWALDVSGFQVTRWTSFQSSVTSVFLMGRLYEHLKLLLPMRVYEGERVFLFGFCFPLAQNCYAHRCFLNRLNKGLLTTYGAPESHQICAVLEALWKMSKIWIWRTE